VVGLIRADFCEFLVRPDWFGHLSDRWCSMYPVKFWCSGQKRKETLIFNSLPRRTQLIWTRGVQESILFVMGDL
jgi:hypothetical protein